MKVKINKGQKRVEKYKDEYILFWENKIVGHSPNLKEILDVSPEKIIF